jgi:hypothetical protein
MPKLDKKAPTGAFFIGADRCSVVIVSVSRQFSEFPLVCRPPNCIKING